MWQDITNAHKEGYKRLLQQGKGLVFLHHSLVSYQKWPEFEQIIGGKYIETPDSGETASTYQHDVYVSISIADASHPVTKGLDDFTLYDEVYGNYRVSSDVHHLLTTDHPQSSKTIAWCKEIKSSRLVYIQPGHGSPTFNDTHYQRLLYQAIQWVNKKGR